MQFFKLLMLGKWYEIIFLITCVVLFLINPFIAAAVFISGAYLFGYLEQRTKKQKYEVTTDTSNMFMSAEAKREYMKSAKWQSLRSQVFAER